ncbi:hypothetical protein ACTWP4_18805 [Gracilibacillus sp. D59]|uniref:hypothetical protein n=1 Tax=Gracilibacillus sp. D59 TaxID=3457434 RepID=UPI003FCC5C37
MKVIAGEWKKLDPFEQVDKLTEAALNNRVGFFLRIRNSRNSKEIYKKGVKNYA